VIQPGFKWAARLLGRILVGSVLLLPLIAGCMQGPRGTGLAERGRAYPKFAYSHELHKVVSEIPADNRVVLEYASWRWLGRILGQESGSDDLLALAKRRQQALCELTRGDSERARMLLEERSNREARAVLASVPGAAVEQRVEHFARQFMVVVADSFRSDVPPMYWLDFFADGDRIRGYSVRGFGDLERVSPEHRPSSWRVWLDGYLFEAGSCVLALAVQSRSDPP
jgi:hypothetical protein